MTTTQRRALEEYLAFNYPFDVKLDPSGGYIVLFPDLPGCYTGADTLEQLPAMVEEARTLWLKTAHRQGVEIPLPSGTAECSGKLLLRVPNSLHRRLLDQAAQDGVTLNHYVSDVLARVVAQSNVEERLEALEQHLETLLEYLKHVELLISPSCAVRNAVR